MLQLFLLPSGAQHQLSPVARLQQLNTQLTCFSLLLSTGFDLLQKRLSQKVLLICGPGCVACSLNFFLFLIYKGVHLTLCLSAIRVHLAHTTISHAPTCACCLLRATCAALTLCLSAKIRVHLAHPYLSYSYTCACCLLRATCAAVTLCLSAIGVHLAHPYLTCSYLCLLSSECNLCCHNPLPLSNKGTFGTSLSLILLLPVSVVF
jgi:hypothetical protein